MASPPFNPSEATPADNSLVSAYPAAERTFRDIIESWLLYEHGRSGHHTFLSGSTAAIAAITTWEIGSLVYDTTKEELQICSNDSPITFTSVTRFNTGVAADDFDIIKVSASATYSGVAELATDAAAITGTDTGRVTTPANVKAVLDARAASDTVSGLAEIAIQSEMETGTDTGRIVCPGRQHFHPGHPKCWAYVTGNGTPSISASYNITSISDTGVGILTVTIANDFTNGNWTLVATAGNDNSDYATGEGVSVSYHSKTAGTVVLIADDGDEDGGQSDLADPWAWDFVAFGDMP